MLPHYRIRLVRVSRGSRGLFDNFRFHVRPGLRELPGLDRACRRATPGREKRRGLSCEAAHKLRLAVFVEVHQCGVVALAVVEAGQSGRILGEPPFAVAQEDPGFAVAGQGDQVRPLVANSPSGDSAQS